MMALAFPAIDPELVSIGPFTIRWYALSYVAGIFLGWRYVVWISRHSPIRLDRDLIDGFVIWLTLGVIAGGRLGYVLFYKPEYYIIHPEEIFYVWQGGMSFHGGLIGVCLAIFLYAKRHGLSVLGFGEIIASASTIGLALGRIANFINGELYGRASSVPWAMYFPADPLVARHPSQLYEALLEGVVLLVILHLAWTRTKLPMRTGTIAGIFLGGYGFMRFLVEFTREPDAFLGFVLGGLSMGQVLSIPMILIGATLILMAHRNKPAETRPRRRRN